MNTQNFEDVDDYDERIPYVSFLRPATALSINKNTLNQNNEIISDNSSEIEDDITNVFNENFENALTGSNDISIVKNESFDVEMASWLLSQKDILTNEEKRRLKILFKNRKKGNCFEAYYKLGKFAEGTIGRCTIKNGVGLQGLSRDIRNALAVKFYWDIDFKNAQVEILKQVCKKFGWGCDKLEEYCVNREQIFSRLIENYDVSRENVKNEFISILFGQKWSRFRDTFISDFQKEVQLIMRNIADKFPNLLKKCKKQHNPIGSCCALYLQTEERKCLTALDNFMTKNGRYLAVPIHDGGYIEKIKNEYEPPIHLIPDAEEFVFKATTYKLSLAFKPITTSFEIPEPNIVMTNKDEYEFKKREFEKTMFKCVDNGYYYEFSESVIKIRNRQKLLECYEHLNYKELSKNDEVLEKSFISKWLKDSSIRKYEYVELLPPPCICPDNTFNLWTGYEIEKTLINDDDEISLKDDFEFLINHFKLIFDDPENPEFFKYALNYIAMLIQKPGVRPNVAFIVKSKQGLGKGFIFNILSLMIGEKYSLITEKIDQHVFGQFNSLCIGKILFGFDEMNIKVSKNLDDKIKEFLTADKQLINPKGKDTFEVANYNTTFIFTNGDMPLIISKDDRRLIGIDSSHKEIPPSEYFQRLLALMDDKRAVRMLFNYFMNIDISNFDAKRDRPVSEFINDIKELSRPLEISFIIDFFQENTKEMIFAHDFFIEFSNWLTKNFLHEAKYNTNAISFGKKIKNLRIDGLNKDVVRDKHDNKTKNAYLFDLTKINLWMIKNKYILPRLLQ